MLPPRIVAALSAALLASAAPVFAHDAIPGAAVQDGIVFGPQVRLTGVYFTNFENSLFVECASADACATWPKLEQERLVCQPDACSNLESRIRKLNGSHDRWGEFAITFIGRRSARRAQSSSWAIPRAKSCLSASCNSICARPIRRQSELDPTRSPPIHLQTAGAARAGSFASSFAAETGPLKARVKTTRAIAASFFISRTG